MLWKPSALVQSKKIFNCLKWHCQLFKNPYFFVETDTKIIRSWWGGFQSDVEGYFKQNISRIREQSSSPSRGFSLINAPRKLSNSHNAIFHILAKGRGKKFKGKMKTWKHNKKIFLLISFKFCLPTFERMSKAGFSADSNTNDTFLHRIYGSWKTSREHQAIIFA